MRLHLSTLIVLIGLLALAVATCSLSVHGASAAEVGPMESWSSAEVGAWIESIGLLRFKASFVGARIDGRMLTAMTDAQLNMFLEDDPRAFDILASEFKAVQHRESHAATPKKATKEAETPKKQPVPDGAYVPNDAAATAAATAAASAAISNREYARVAATPVSQWTTGDIVIFLTKQAGGLEYFISRVVDDQLTGAKLLKLAPNELKDIFKEKKFIDRFNTVLHEMLTAQKTDKPTPHTTTYEESVKEVNELNAILAQSVDLPRRAFQPQHADKCGKGLLTEAQDLVFGLLKSHLARKDAEFVVPFNYTDRAPELFVDEQGVGCPRLLRQALPQRDASRKFMVLFGSATKSVHDFMHHHGWSGITLLSFDTTKPALTEDDIPALNFDDLYLNLDPIVGTCALYHSGIIPDVIYVRDTVLQQVFLDGTVAKTAEQYHQSSCGCLDWHTIFSHLPQVQSGQIAGPLILGDLSLPTQSPTLLNSLATRVLKRRVYYDAPCFAISDAHGTFNASTEAIPELPRISLQCNDSYSDGLLHPSKDLPLVSAYMVLDPAKNLDRSIARIEASLESFGKGVDNFVLINLEDGDSAAGMEEQARFYSLLKEIGQDYKNIRHTKLLNWKLSDFGNSYAKLRNHALKYLSGMDLTDLSSSKFKSVYILHIQSEEAFESEKSGEYLRTFLLQQLQLCGPSSSAIQVSILTNSTTTDLQSRIIRTGNHLRYKWDPDYPSDEEMYGYISSSNERYLSWGREKFGYELPVVGRLNPLSSDSVVSALTLTRPSLATPVDRLMRDVGQLMAQEAELYAKLEWWQNRYPPSAENNFTTPKPPQRWIRLLEHTHMTLAQAYGKNGQPIDAYQYYLKRVNDLVPTPMWSNFSSAVESPSAQKRTAEWKHFEGDEIAACSALYHLYQLHTQLNSTDLAGATVGDLLATVKTRTYNKNNLHDYYRLQLSIHCIDLQPESLYLTLADEVKREKFVTALELISTHLSAISTLPCRLDRDICRSKLPGLLLKVHEWQEKQ